MPEEVKTVRPPIGETEDLDSSQRIVRAIIGGVVVVLLILLALGLVNFIRSRFQTSSTPKTTISQTATIPLKTAAPALTTVNPAPEANYETMPETGPEQLGFAVLIFSLVAGSTTIAISRKFS